MSDQPPPTSPPLSATVDPSSADAAPRKKKVKKGEKKPKAHHSGDRKQQPSMEMGAGMADPHAPNRPPSFKSDDEDAFSMPLRRRNTAGEDARVVVTLEDEFGHIRSHHDGASGSDGGASGAENDMLLAQQHRAQLERAQPQSAIAESSLATIPLGLRVQALSDLDTVTAASDHGVTDEDEDDDALAPLMLTSMELRLVRKALVTEQVRTELAHFASSMSLRSLAPPSIVPIRHTATVPVLPSDTESSDADSVRAGATTVLTEERLAYFTPTPFLQHSFHAHVLTFPFLQGANPEFWDKLQQVLNESRRRGLGKSREPVDALKRRRIWKRIERGLVAKYTTAIKIGEGRSEQEAISPSPAPANGDMPPDNAPEHATTTASTTVTAAPALMIQHGILVDVITVRACRPQGRFASTMRPGSVHAEFIIRAQLSYTTPPVLTVRSLKALKHLHANLRRQYPNLRIPFPPHPYPGNATKEMAARVDAGHQFAEKDRVLVRSWLRRLIGEPELARSDILRRWLLHPDNEGEASAVTELTHAETIDVERRNAIEEFRRRERQRVRDEAERRTRLLQSDLAQLRREMMSPGGTDRALNALEHIPVLSELPAHYHCLFQYLQVQFAAFLYTNYYAGDDAPARVQALQRMYSIIPWRTLRGVLHISNPTAMMKALMDLLMAKPFGAKSLLQRLLITNFGEQVKACTADIEATEAAIGDASFCRKIRSYINNPSQYFADDAYLNDSELIAKILKDRSRPPMLTLAQMSRLYPDGDVAPPDGPLFQLLRRYLALESRRRDKEQMVEVIQEPAMVNMLRELVTVIYKPLAQVYRAANVAEYVMDVKEFFDDLLKVLERLEMTQQPNDQSSVNGEKATGNNVAPRLPVYNNPLDAFTELCERHLQPFYHFVHRVYARDKDGLFRQMAGWGADLQRFLMHGTGSSPPIDLNALVRDEIRRGWQRRELRHDLSTLAKYRKAVKDRRTRKLRDRLARGGNDELWDEKDVEAVISELGLPSMEEAADLIADMEEERHEMEQEVSEAYAEIGGVVEGIERSRFGWRSRSGTGAQRRGHKEPLVPEPELKVVPSLLKSFMRTVAGRLIV